MSLSCRKNGHVIYSFQYNLKDWIELKEDKESVFRMGCCDNQAILKTSKLGTQFFAHKVKPKHTNCSTGGESAEHIHIKYLVMKELDKNGWAVEVEKRGATPNGEEWIADIYAEKGKAKIAIEVQWSPQAFVETRRRQEKYAQSGVRCAWLLRSGSIKARDAIVGDYAYSTKDMPVFSIYRNKRQDGQTYIVYNVNKLKTGSGDPLEPIALELEDFIKSLVSSRIRFTKKYSPVKKLYLEIIKQKCWNKHCEGITNLVARMYFKEIVFGIEIEYLLQSKVIDDCDDQMVNAINSQFAQAYNFAPLRLRYNKTADKNVISNSCIHCDDFLDSHFIVYGKLKTHCINIPNKGDLIEQGESFEFGKWVIAEG